MFSAKSKATSSSALKPSEVIPIHDEENNAVVIADELAPYIPNSSPGASSSKAPIRETPSKPSSSRPHTPPNTSTRHSKPVHPFFKKPEQKQLHISVIDIDESDEDSGSRDAPIDLRESPIRPASPHSGLKKTTRHRKDSSTLPPWPTAETQHVRDSYTPFLVMASGWQRKLLRANLPLALDTDDTLKAGLISTPPSYSYTRRSPFSVTPSDTPSSEHRNHPAFSRQHPSQSSGSKQDAWVDQYRPVRADQLLGNERSGQYIKEWLLALELSLDTSTSSPPVASAQPRKRKRAKGENGPSTRGAKRPRIVRTVDKAERRKQRKRVSNSSHWIVDSDDEDEAEDVIPHHDDGFDDLLHPGDPLPGAVLSYDFSTYLSNSLLIVGPPGSGKTAAVYACAAELDWEVFELNSGWGKRSGANVVAMLEGVGKNHTLGVEASNGRKTDLKGKRKTSDKETTSQSLHSIFAKATEAREDIPGELGAKGESLEASDSIEEGRRSVGYMVEEEGLTDSLHASPKDAPIRKVNQSIILLDEVDVLFSGEATFWPTVVNIIKESRRPVIMTCTGSSSPPHSYPCRF